MATSDEALHQRVQDVLIVRSPFGVPANTIANDRCPECAGGVDGVGTSAGTAVASAAARS